MRVFNVCVVSDASTVRKFVCGSNQEKLEGIVSNDANKLVHIVDDDAAMRTALKRLLNSAGYSVKDYASAGEFLVSEPEERRGCLLLDLVLGGPSGLELQQALLRRANRMPVIFMSAYSDVPQSVRAMKAGAVDFLVKPFTSDVLLGALNAAFMKCTAPSTRTAAPDVPDIISLGDREKSVLHGIVSGRRNKQIAAELGLSERTIKSCRAELMRKFGAASLAELLRSAQTRTGAA